MKLDKLTTMLFIAVILQVLAQETISTGDVHCGEVPVVKFGSVSHGVSNVGSRRLINCRGFTKLQGNNTIECQSNGQWSQPGQCKVITCDAPVIANAITSSGTNEFGHRAMFSCHHGFKLVGSNQIECKRDSTWDIQGSCVSFCGALPEIENGKYKIEGLSAELACNDGFQVQGNTTSSCNVELKQWTAVGKCAKAIPGFTNYTQSFINTCGPVPVVKNGSVSVSEGEGFLVGMIKCEPDFEVVGDRVFFCLPTGTMTQPGSCQIPIIDKASSKNKTNVSGKARFAHVEHLPFWDILPIKQCDEFPPVPNGKVSPGHRENGAVRTITCDPGYHLVGPNETVCQKSQLWSEIGKCILHVCDAPQIPNAFVPNIPNLGHIGSTVFFTCEFRYSLEGSNKITCKSDGNWMVNGSCQPTCGEEPTLPHATVVLSIDELRREIKCDPTFTLQGEPEVVCESGKWHYKGKCSQTCKNIPTIANGQTALVDIRDESVRKITCNAGFTFQGGNAKMKCDQGDSWNYSGRCILKCLEPIFSTPNFIKSKHPHLSAIGVESVGEMWIRNETIVAEIVNKLEGN